MVRIAVLTALALLALAEVARGEALVPVHGGFASSPMYVTSPPDDTRLFVVERAGGIRIVKDGVVQATPFLTVPNVKTNFERGLSTMAFAPDYATSGRFYVFKTLDDRGQPDDGQIQTVEYRRSADPDMADPASARIVLNRDHPAGNHYGGQLAFGPDGYLYVTMGDGGTGGPNGQATNTTLGKVLRIDPRAQANGDPYGVPPGNPFPGHPRCGPGDATEPCPEIYAYGLRNPFRASFDRATGELIVGDVGQDTWEEVDMAHAGDNLGWDACEGEFARGSATTPCPIAQRPPIFAYPHDAGTPEQTGCAIIGGYVVHDSRLTALDGRYLYGDLCRTDLRTLDPAKPGGDPKPAGLEIAAPVTLFAFGQDAQGCVYVAADHTVYRVAAAADAPFTCPGPPRRTAPAPPSGGSGEQSGSGTGSASTPLADNAASTPDAGKAAPTPPVLTDVTAPTLRLRSGRSQRLARAVRVTAACNEPCDLFATGVLRFNPGAAASTKPRPARRHADGGTRVALRLRLGRSERARARRTLVAGGRVTAAVTVTARDASGNARHTSRRIRLR
ncbi:MAG: PQQ-dependent sugar dehydrogenase [Solirubrobacteraceae bacterium]